MPLQFKQATLDNGLTVIGEVDPDAHTSAIGFFVKTGARDENSVVMGVSHFLEHMMFKGTETRTAADVDLDFDSIGANHNAFTTSEMTAFWCHCLPEHLARGEEILSDIMRPAIREKDFDDEKDVILEEIAMYQDQPFWVLYERVQEVFYGAHPLSHRVLGTAETVRNMPHDKMTDYFARRYASDNTVVALGGKFDFDEMTKRLETHCGTWARGEPGRAFPALNPPREDFTVESATANRHYAIMMAPAPGMEDDRRYAAAMLMNILGEGDSSRLHWALIEPGLADEAVAEYDGHDATGQFLLYCCCPPGDAEKIEGILRREAASLVDSLTDDDLLRVRSRAATAATLHGELPSGRMRRLGRVWTYAGAYRSLEDELERMGKVTLAELREVAEAFPIEPIVVGRLRPKA